MLPKTVAGHDRRDRETDAGISRRLIDWVWQLELCRDLKASVA
jgi:hypothetical protein